MLKKLFIIWPITLKISSFFNRLAATLAFFFVILFVFSCNTDQSTWKVSNGVVYGARPDSTGPIGGGEGYTHIITEGDYTVRSLDELLAALDKAKEGDIIYLPGEVTINLTARIYIEDLLLEIPGGVTLASNRGSQNSRGALLFSDALDTPALIRAMGPDVRVTGLRIQGPNPRRYLEHHRRSFGKKGKGRSYYYQFPTSRGIETDYKHLEVDNCEISGFAHTAVSLNKGKNHHIHHNFIHHNQYNGLGYGIALNKAKSIIEYNIFDWNRHSIAGTGRPGCNYTARHNIQKENSLSHAFDMHGGQDRNDGTNISGTYIQIYNNTFYTDKLPVKIRGIPEKEGAVYNNWFKEHHTIERAVVYKVNIEVKNNLLGK